jgi:hypothetical protein
MKPAITMGTIAAESPTQAIAQGLCPLPCFFAAACYRTCSTLPLPTESQDTEANNGKELQSHRTQAAAKAGRTGEATLT